MDKLKTALQKIVGRTKKKMADWLLTWGNIFFPAGLVFMILGLNYGEDYRGFLSLLVAFVFFIMGSFYMTRAWKLLWRKESEDRIRFYQLLGEIKGIREDIGGKNDQTNDTG
ncbi:hypothetical protein ACFLU1_00055 [Chloroflexota bacterium]